MYGLQEFFFSHPLPFASLLLFLFISAKFLLSTASPTKKKKNLNLPPSPWKLPVLGNLHQLGTHPHRTLRCLSQTRGPLFLLHLGSAPTLIASSPESAKEIMKTHDLLFSNRPYSAISNRLLYNYKDLSQAPYGEYWRQMRSICVLRLLSAKRVDSFRCIRQQEAALLVRRIEEHAISVAGTPLNLGELISKITNDVVCRVAFGRKYGDGEKGKQFKLLLEEFGAALGTVNVADFIPWLGWINRFNGLNRKVEKVFKEFDEFLDQVVEDHSLTMNEEKSEDEKDLVDVLLQIQRETPNSAVDRDTIKAIVLDMFAAGSDTTYTALEWTMTEILRHPTVMKKLQQEIRAIVGDEGHAKEEEMERMGYLKAVIKESFRLHPPIPLLVPRESTQDVKVQGYDVVAKTRVIVNAWAIGRDPRRWEDAEEFRPERFLNSTVDFKGQDFELIPFGAGRRGCPGISFATASIEITLVSMLHRLDWSVLGEDGLDAEEAPGLAVHRKKPLLAVPTLYSP